MAKSPYHALVGADAKFAGIDQGIDFTGAGPVYALQPGRVTRVAKSGTGWPGTGALLAYVFTDGPAKGKHVYIAEDFAPAAGLKVGSTFKQGDVLGQATGSGLAPGIEVGWADSLGRPVAPLPPPRPASQYTKEGQSFSDFVQAAGGTQGSDIGDGGALAPVTDVAVSAKNTATTATKALTGWVGDLTDWLSKKGKLILAYVLLIGVAGGLFLTGLKGLGVPVPKVAPVPVPV